MLNKTVAEESISLMNQMSQDESLLYQEKIGLLIEQREFNLVALLKPKIFIDGNMWCVLYGDNIQEGVCGFGKSPAKAIYEFNKAWHKEI